MSGGQGVEVAVPDGTNLHLYRVDAERASGRGLQTDAITCMLGLNLEGDWLSYALCEGTELLRDGKHLISSDVPATAAFSRWTDYTRRTDRLPVRTIEDDVLHGVVKVATDASLRCFTGQNCTSVTIDGIPLTPTGFDPATGLLTLAIPAGTHTLTIRL